MSINLNILENVQISKNAADRKHNVVYQDLHLDLQKKYTQNDQVQKQLEIADIVSDINGQAIRNSLYNIFSTSPGQKILNPEFGLNFEQWLFTQLSENKALSIKQKIYRQVERYEPRVTITNIDVIPDYEQNQYNVSIQYNNNEIFTFNLTETGITNG